MQAADQAKVHVQETVTTAGWALHCAINLGAWLKVSCPLMAHSFFTGKSRQHRANGALISGDSDMQGQRQQNCQRQQSMQSVCNLGAPGV